jgi:hypothetical protein
LPAVLRAGNSLDANLKNLLTEGLIGTKFLFRKQKCVLNLVNLRKQFEDGYAKDSVPQELINCLNHLNAACEDGLDTRKNMVAGITAAALTPVFLRLISSNLFVAAADDWFSTLTFFSFCLLAGMLGVEFIKTVVKLFRSSVKLAEKKINDVKDAKSNE